LKGGREIQAQKVQRELKRQREKEKKPKLALRELQLREGSKG